MSSNTKNLQLHYFILEDRKGIALCPAGRQLGTSQGHGTRTRQPAKKKNCDHPRKSILKKTGFANLTEAVRYVAQHEPL